MEVYYRGGIMPVKKSKRYDTKSDAINEIEILMKTGGLTLYSIMEVYGKDIPKDML